MAIECPICTRPCSEGEYARHHLKFSIAMLGDEPEPSCGKFVLRSYRGIEGVVDHPFTSRPVVDHGPLFLRDKQERVC